MVINLNRQYISSLFHAVKYCGRQEIPLRGHRHDGYLYGEIDTKRDSIKELIMLISKCDV